MRPRRFFAKNWGWASGEASSVSDPAGENLIRFAMISGDGGHVVAHNGMGAVMGSKRLKAIVVARGKAEFPISG